MSLYNGKLYLRYSSVLFKVGVWNEVVPHFSNRTLEYLRHNFPLYRLIANFKQENIYLDKLYKLV